MNDVFSNDLIAKQASGLVAAVTPAPCSTLVMRLYTNNIAPSANVLLTDLTPAVFPGYAEPTITGWRSEYTNLTGEIVVSPSVNPVFSCSGSNTTPPAQGYACFRPDTTALQIMGQFSTAITPQSGQQFSVVVELAPNGTIASSTY